jgi:hypothetical protein
MDFNAAMRKTSSILFTLPLILSACFSAGPSASPSAAVAATATQQPAATATIMLPTPSSPGATITWKNLQVTLGDLGITQEYETEYGSKRIPPAGQKFLWVEVHLKNTGQIEVQVPAVEHFSVLYAGTELKPAYGHRKDFADYTTLGPILFPDHAVDAWLRFDIPLNAELPDLRFVFLPESAQVGTSFESPEYPYSRDKPTFVWNCTP